MSANEMPLGCLCVHVCVCVYMCVCVELARARQEAFNVFKKNHADTRAMEYLRKVLIAKLVTVSLDYS